MMVIKMIAILIVITILLFFAGENNELLQLHFGPYETIPAPVYLLIMIFLVIGMVIAMVISFIEKLKIRGELRTLRKEKKKIEGELNSLRKMPIVESSKSKLPPETEADSMKGSA